MSKSKLKDIDGQKIRRQYFNIPLIFLYSLMIMVPYTIFINSIFTGKADLYEWLSSLWISIWVCFCFSLPILILRTLNKYFFGRIICVLANDGIHYPRGMVRWETIEKIEYVIDSKPRYKSDSSKAFRVVIYTRGGKHIVLTSAPISIVSRIKKLRKDIDIKISGATSLLPGMLIMATIILLCPFYVMLIRKAPGVSTVKLVVATVIMLVLTIARIPIFSAYAIEYRFWRRILPNKVLSYIILGCYYSSAFVCLLILCYFPNWIVTVLVGIYIGIVDPPIPSRRGNKSGRCLSYEELYELYIVKADIWEEKVKKSKRWQH